ncbi:MAG TPA: hypothetical protein VH253_15935 [Phycisphaerae bacterium]|nr:hypothetical protein [Phycisphaerae bacterium]
MSKPLPADVVELAETAEERELLERAAGAARTDVELAGGFNDRLHERLTAPVGRAGRERRWRQVAGLAAMLLVGAWLGATLFSRGGNPLVGGVAWADVVRAVNHVQQLHVLAYQESPQSGGNMPPLSRLDLYYQARAGAAGMWRAQGLGHVQFLTPGEKPESRTWSVAEKQWTTRDNVRLIPQGMTGKVESGDLLEVVLTWIFHGAAPEAQPVKNDALTGAGIDVFDYATDAASPWARIWVTRDSRLPVRIKMYAPASDGFLLLEFDYGEAEPADFFNPEAFEAGMGRLDAEAATRPARAYEMGAAPVDNLRPQTARQIHTVQPEAVAPKVISATRLASGDIVLVTTSPRNVNAGGSADEFELHDVVDDQGTRYAAEWFSEGVHVNEESPRTTWLIPVSAPVGEVKSVKARVFTRAAEAQELGELEAAVTEGSVPSARGPTAEGRFAALRAYWQNGTVAERRAFVERALAEHPHDAGAVRAKMELLFELGKREEGWALYEQEMLPEALETLLDDEANVTLFAGYVLWLENQGRGTEAKVLTEKGRKVVEEAAFGKDARRKAAAMQALRPEEWNLFGKVLKLPELESWVVGSNKPVVKQMIVGEDGVVVVQVALPGNLPASVMGPVRGGSMAADYALWAGMTAADVTAEGRAVWRQTGAAYDPATHTLALGFRGSGKKLTLTKQITLLQDAYPSAAGDLQYAWKLAVATPAASTESAAAWWAKNVPADPSKWWADQRPVPSPFDASQIVAEEALRAGRNAEAAGLYGELIRTLDRAGPPPGVTGDNAVALRDSLEEGRVEALTGAGDLTGAEKALRAWEEELPGAPDFHKRFVVERYEKVNGAGAKLAEALMDAGEAEAARRVLDGLEKARPDLKDEVDVLVREAGNGGVWWYVGENRGAWVAVDRARWRMMKSE